MKVKQLFIILCITVQVCLSGTLSTAEIVRKSNVFYDAASFQTGYMHIPPYVANGIIGGCFDHMGFQSQPNKGIPNGRTVLGYIGHYYMHKETTRQAQLPLAIIQAQFADGSSVYNMMDAKNYSQELDLYTGVLHTNYNLFGDTRITTFAHQSIPNLFIMKIDRQANTPQKEMIVHFHCETSASQNTKINWPADPVALDFQVNANQADIVSSTNMVHTHWTIRSNNIIEQDGNTLSIRLQENENVIKVWVHRDDVNETDLLDLDFAELLKRHTTAWETNWERSWIDFPEERAHHVWNRGNYYNLSNFPIIPEKALIPTGMNTNIWGFTFPQDVYYVAENLLRSGHFDRYEKSMRYWLEILPEVNKYSERIMDVQGGFYPWTPPFDQWDEFEKDEIVGKDSYEIHNPAYVAAMVWYYYQRTGDIEFLTKYFPIIEQVWLFYTNVLHENDNGTYDIDHHKAAGQDEASKLKSSKNLMCASYSAEYTARNYIQAAGLVKNYDKQLYKKAKSVLQAGLEREALLRPEGFYATYEGDNRPLNSQKHPVQLNCITFCPMAEQVPPDGPTIKAWKNRYDLTVQAKKPISHGWTYAAFALASSRLGSPQAFASDLSAIQFCAHADPRWIQFYEFTFWERYTLYTAYYFPTHGLYQQAFTDAVLQDWRGYVDLFACMLPEWRDKKIAFHGLSTLNGVTVDAIYDNGKVKVVLNPNGADKITLRIGMDVGELFVSGQKNGIKRMPSQKRVTLYFQDEPIVLQN